jgi:hypothetical protein
MTDIWGRNWLLAGGLCLAGCVSANAPQNCAPDETYGTTLAIEDAHDLSNHYDVFALTVKVDGCIFFQTEDTSLLSKPVLDIPARPVSFGPHTIEIASQYRSGFGADMHDYEWWMRGTLQAEFQSGHAHTLVIHRSEIMNRDPRQRVQTNITVRVD